MFNIKIIFIKIYLFRLRCPSSCWSTCIWAIPGRTAKWWTWIYPVRWWRPIVWATCPPYPGCSPDPKFGKPKSKLWRPAGKRFRPAHNTSKTGFNDTAYWHRHLKFSIYYNIGFTYGSPKIHGRDLGQVHRGQSSVKSGVDADEEPADDDQLVRRVHLRNAYKKSRTHDV